MLRLSSRRPKWQTLTVGAVLVGTVISFSNFAASADAQHAWATFGWGMLMYVLHLTALILMKRWE